MEKRKVFWGGEFEKNRDSHGRILGKSEKIQYFSRILYLKIQKFCFKRAEKHERHGEQNTIFLGGKGERKVEKVTSRDREKGAGLGEK